MIPTTITCAYCAGHDFYLHITLAGSTALQCVKHEEHVKEIDLAGQVRAKEEEFDRELKHEQ